MSIELPVTTRHRRDMTEKLLKATLNPNSHTHTHSINQHNQSTVETVTAILNMFFKQKSEIKHMYTMGVVVIKICAFLLDVL